MKRRICYISATRAEYGPMILIHMVKQRQAKKFSSLLRRFH